MNEIDSIEIKYRDNNPPVRIQFPLLKDIQELENLSTVLIRVTEMYSRFNKLGCECKK